MPMRCTGFIEGYTDFRDGLLSASREVEFRAHIRACPACERYHHVLQDGLELLADLPEPETSDDFMPRLQHRLYNVDEGVLHTTSNRFLGSAALVAVASVGLLALAWLPFAASVPIEIELPAVAVERPAEQLVTREQPVPSLLRPGPFVQPASTGELSPRQSFLDGERPWYPARQQGPKVFLTADLR
jgi:anti-sigma factor RsiW